MQIYHCPSCGADLMAGQTQAATFCSYCGFPSIIYDRVSKEAKPSKIIPFKLSESQALSCIRDRFGHGKYIPPQIRKLTVEKIHAIYVPYWLYTAHIRKKILMHSQQNMVITNTTGMYHAHTTIYQWMVRFVLVMIFQNVWNHFT